MSPDPGIRPEVLRPEVLPVRIVPDGRPVAITDHQAMVLLLVMACVPPAAGILRAILCAMGTG